MNVHRILQQGPVDDKEKRDDMLALHANNHALKK